MGEMQSAQLDEHQKKVESLKLVSSLVKAVLL